MVDQRGRPPLPGKRGVWEGVWTTPLSHSPSYGPVKLVAKHQAPNKEVSKGRPKGCVLIQGLQRWHVIVFEVCENLPSAPH